MKAVNPLHASLPANLLNPYWDRVAKHVSDEPDPTWDTYTIGGRRVPRRDPGEASYEGWMLRREVTSQYAWTVTAPATLDFVRQHCTKRVVDPLAGTGYWGYLLAQCAIRVISSDVCPPNKNSTLNAWHQNASTFVDVRRAEGAVTAQMSVESDTLLLSWPPFADSTGFDVVSAFAGNRLIFIGEGAGGCTGDDAMWELLGAEWTERDWHQPVQFDGIHDYVWAFDRNRPSDSS